MSVYLSVYLSARSVIQLGSVVSSLKTQSTNTLTQLAHFSTLWIQVCGIHTQIVKVVCVCVYVHVCVLEVFLFRAYVCVCCALLVFLESYIYVCICVL